MEGMQSLIYETIRVFPDIILSCLKINEEDKYQKFDITLSEPEYDQKIGTAKFIVYFVKYTKKNRKKKGSIECLLVFEPKSKLIYETEAECIAEIIALAMKEDQDTSGLCIKAADGWRDEEL